MADKNIAAIEGTSFGTSKSPRTIVCTDATTVYQFYCSSDQTIISYKKSTDSGATWGSEVQIVGTYDCMVLDVWFDKWTPGDSGTKIHLWFLRSSGSDVFYVSLDTASDTVGTLYTAFNGATVVNEAGVFVSGCKTVSGYLYCAYQIDSGTEKGLIRSTDSGATWGSSLSSTFVEARRDLCTLLPAATTGDNNDCFAVYSDRSVNELTVKLWDSSAGSATESSVLTSYDQGGVTDGTCQGGFSASIRHSDGHLIISVVTEYDTATSDHRIFDVTDTSTITELTAITTNIDDHFHNSVFIDQSTDDIYVAYNGKSDGSDTLGTTTKTYFAKSTNGGTSWSVDNGLMQDSAAAVYQVWTPLMGALFIASWRIGSAIYSNIEAAGPVSHALDSAATAGSATSSATMDRSRIHALTSASSGSSATSSATMAVSRPHALTSAAVAQSAASSATFNDIGVLDLVSAAIVQAATSSGTFLRSFPGAHDIIVLCIAGHAAVNSSFQRVTGRVFDSAAVAGSAVSSATLALTRIASSFLAKFDSLTGTPKIQILRIRDVTTYDSSDATFKASPSLANAQMTMTQVNATLWPTYYLKAIDPTNWTDGEYMTHAVDDGDSANYRFDSYIYKNGTLFYGGLLTDERAAVLTSAAQSGLLTDEEHNILVTGIPASISSLPAAVLSAAQAAPIHADMRNTVGTPLQGDGTEADKFRSTLVP